MWIQLISSLLLGSSLGKVLSEFLIKSFGVSLISSSIPGVTEKLVAEKSFDLVNFTISSIATFLIYIVLTFKAKDKEQRNKVASRYLLICLFVIFIQTHFVEYSGKSVLTLTGVVFVLYFLINKIKQKNFAHEGPTLINSILLGLNLMLIVNRLSTSFALPIIVFITVLFLYSLIKIDQKYTTSPVHLILALSVLFSDNSKELFFVLALFLFVLYLTKGLDIASLKKFLFKNIYPVVVVFTIFFDPGFYLGNFDSIEEGFWLAWWQRLTFGDVAYLDFLMYHPPLILWGLEVFGKFWGESIWSFRLYLHLLQIGGLTIIYFLVNSVLKKKSNVIIALTIIAALTTTSFVRNNSEIRIAAGMLPMLVLWSKKEGLWKDMLVGTFSVIAILVSIETGLSSLLAVTLYLFLFKRQRQVVIKYFFGLIVGFLPFAMYFSLSSSFFPMIRQIFYYAGAFSEGYFNLAMERSIQTSHFRWHLFFEYLSSSAFYWELSSMAIIGSLVFFVTKLPNYLKNIRTNSFSESDQKIFTLAIYGLILFRSALGRSDFHHLLFVLVIGIIILFYFIEYLSKSWRTVSITMFLVLIFASSINSKFLSQQIFKFTTHGEEIGEYERVNISRAGISVTPDFNKTELEQIVKFVEDNSEKSDSIFVFPWSPEIYFLTNRANATSSDTPYAFFSYYYQTLLIDELKENKPKIIVYDTSANFGGLSPGALEEVNKYIQETYEQTNQIQSYKIYK